MSGGDCRIFLGVFATVGVGGEKTTGVSADFAARLKSVAGGVAGTSYFWICNK